MIVDHIVYLLGAGFSAPLGIPVMRNFLIRSKDMFAADPIRYKSFAQVFSLIREMNVAKSYYEANLFNIEEILSILEMRDQLGGKRAKRFIRYIAEVIRHTTPPVPVSDTSRYPGNWHARVLSEAPIWQPYFYFVANLFALRINRPLDQAFNVDSDEARAHYSIITLNYDLGLETMADFLGSSFRGGGNFRFAVVPGKARDTDVPLAKLHGSADTDRIIAPTWNKGIQKRMAAVWSQAHEILKAANQIRIIGYSLPVADAYIKYLLKSAVIETPHLKQIDILCRDSDGQTLSRYRDFISFDYARFATGDVRDYLAEVKETTTAGVQISDRILRCNRLEVAHNRFFDNHGFDLKAGPPPREAIVV